jgi:hypothetical protein
MYRKNGQEHHLKRAGASSSNNTDISSNTNSSESHKSQTNEARERLRVASSTENELIPMWGSDVVANGVTVGKAELPR